MKLFSLMFSIYILMVACLPCGDVDDCKVAGQEKVSFLETSHTDHKEDTETCSPFCICACCGANIDYSFIFQLYSTIKPSILYFQKSKSVYLNKSVSSNFFGNIWQPPKFI